MKKITGLEFLAILFNSFIGAVLLIDAIKNGSNGYIYTASVCLFASFVAGYMFQFHRESKELKEMYNTEVECNLKQRDKMDVLKLEVDEKYQEISLLRQKYSRTNQPRSSGKFVKKQLSPESVCLENLGLLVINGDGHYGKIAGYDKDDTILDSMCLIIGMESNSGWITIYDADIILEKYDSYKYCSYQDILDAKISKRMTEQ